MARIIKNSAVLIIVAAMLMGCSAQSPTAATYEQFSESDATAAYREGLKQDFLDRSLTTQDLDDAGVDRMQQAVYANMHDDDAEKTAASNAMESLVSVKLNVCQWQSIDERNINIQGRARVRDKVEAGYYCDFQVSHRTDDRGIVSGFGSGYFYKSGKKPVFAGIYGHDFQ
jgi:uncharacterized lipoprotein YmbA